jgi:hypothetical protein
MIGERHSVFGAPFRKLGHLVTVGPDLIFTQPNPSRKWGVTVALNCSGGLPINNTRRIHRFEQRHLRGDAILLHFNIAFEQKSRKLATTYADAMPLQNRTKDGWVHWKPAAGFHTREAHLLGFGKASFKGNSAAQFWQTIVPPGN